jgi:hypothetical protein
VVPVLFGSGLLPLQPTPASRSLDPLDSNRLSDLSRPLILFSFHSKFLFIFRFSLSAFLIESDRPQPAVRSRSRVNPGAPPSFYVSRGHSSDFPRAARQRIKETEQPRCRPPDGYRRIIRGCCPLLVVKTAPLAELASYRCPKRRRCGSGRSSSEFKNGTSIRSCHVSTILFY